MTTNSVLANRLLSRTTPEAWREKLRALPVTATPRTEALDATPSVVALLAVLHEADGAQIDAWANANANSLPEIRDLLKTILKLLAARL